MIDSPQTAVAEVEALLERRRTAQAKARLKEALQHYPNHPDLLVQSARVDYLDDDNEAALATVRQALAQDPENQPGRLLLFGLMIEKGNLAEAEEIILGLLREHPEHAPYYARYAELMMRVMNIEKARQLADEGLKYSPDDMRCLATRALCDFVGRRPGATSESLQQLLIRYPQSAHTLLLMVIALQGRGEFRAASRIAGELVRAHPDNVHFVRLAAELKAASHWTMLPLWPLARWGWGASAVLWVLGVVSIRVFDSVDRAAAGAFALCFLAYVIYSWAWPPLLRHWIART